MGTLFEQRPRINFVIYNTAGHIRDIIADIEDMRRHGFTVDQAIEIQKLAHNRCEFFDRIQDGDIRDEQLAGFGQLIREFTEAISKAVDVYRSSFEDAEESE